MSLRHALTALGVSVCALVCIPLAHADEPAPHAEVLGSMQLEPLTGPDETYRLIWHAWHRRPGALTLRCGADACLAELRYTNGYGTYRQGELAFVEQRSVSTEEGRSIIAAIEASALWDLAPDLPTEGLYGRRPSDAGRPLGICLHAPHYFIEARTPDRSLLIYRYCQENYADGLEAMAPLIALFDRLFPDHMPQVSAYSDLEERDQRLREIN